MNKLIQRKYIITALLIYVIVIIITFWVGGFPYLTGDFISFGQLVLELLLLPTVIIGFIIAIEEFRKSQAIPDLDILWETQPGKFEKDLKLKIPAEGTARPAARPVIVNNGNAVAIWYVLHFDVPLELYPEELELNREGRLALGPVEQYLNKHWIIHAGQNENWRVDFLGLETMRVTFVGNGQVACYPRVPQPLGLLTLPLHAKYEYPDKCQIVFSIATDKSEPKHGTLVIRLPRDKKSNNPKVANDIVDAAP